MDNVETSLLRALLDLEKAVAGIKATKVDLVPLFARIDDLAAKLPPDTDPTLRHYLQKKSYEKARLFLQGRDAENKIGNCRHV
jgi:hypothetical protein